MSWENPPVPHEVNVSRESVLAEFLRLLAGLGICVLALAALLCFAGGWLARWVPISTEAAWVGDHVIGLPGLDDAPADAGNAHILAQLQAPIRARGGEHRFATGHQVPYTCPRPMFQTPLPPSAAIWSLTAACIGACPARMHSPW